MKRIVSLPWNSGFSPSWLVLPLGVLVGLFTAALSVNTSTGFVIVVPLVGIAFLICTALTLGVLKTSLFAVIIWFFATESIIGSRYFHMDWALSQFIVRLQGVVPGAIFGLMAAYLVLFRRHRWRRGLLPHELWLVVFLILGFFSGLIGLIRGNDLVYLLGDTFKYALFPLTYFTVVSASRTIKSRIWMFRTLVAIGLAYNIAALVMQSFNFLVSSRATLGRGMDFLSWIYVLLVLAHWKVSRHRTTGRWWYILLAVLVILAGILSLERRDWLFVLVSILAVAWISRSKVYATFNLVVVIVVLAALSATLALVFSEQFNASWGFVARRVEFTFDTDQGLDPSSRNRLTEIQLAGEHAIESGGVGNFVLGMGSGAEYYSPTSVSASSNRLGAPSSGLLHQIHNTYFSVLFRMGIVALIVLILFLVSLMSRTYWHLRSLRRGMVAGRLQVERFLFTATLFLFLLITAAVEWNVAYGVGNVQVGIVLGLLGAELCDKDR